RDPRRAGALTQDLAPKTGVLRHRPTEAPLLGLGAWSNPWNDIDPGVARVLREAHQVKRRVHLLPGEGKARIDVDSNQGATTRRVRLGDVAHHAMEKVDLGPRVNEGAVLLREGGAERHRWPVRSSH